MSLELSQVQALTQQLRMTPQLQQAIELLQYDRQELEDFLAEQLAENPLLETQQDAAAREAEAAAQQERETDDGPAAEEVDWDAYLENQDYSDRASGPGTAGYVELPSIEETYAEEPDLTAHLLQQLLERLDTTEEEDALARAIVFSLDDQGYLRDVTMHELAEALDVDIFALEDALALVQDLEPTGVGARDVAECLYLQAVKRWPRDRLLKDLIREHLDKLNTSREEEILAALSMERAELALAKRRLQRLDPYPARDFVTKTTGTEYIAPDVHVREETDGRWTVVADDESLPQMKIAGYYRTTLKGEADPQAKAFVREKLNSARFLIRSIEKRRRTIHRVAQAIVDAQREFFALGPVALQPLILKDIAEVVDMHESTVSRVTRGKYMDTPRGTLEFKYFFNAGIPLVGGGAIASEAVRHRIRELVDEESADRPLSDAALARALKQRHDIDVARRTVAKYRESLNIPSSTERRSRH